MGNSTSAPNPTRPTTTVGEWATLLERLDRMEGNLQMLQGLLLGAPNRLDLGNTTIVLSDGEAKTTIRAGWIELQRGDTVVLLMTGVDGAEIRALSDSVTEPVSAGLYVGSFGSEDPPSASVHITNDRTGGEFEERR